MTEETLKVFGIARHKIETDGTGVRTLIGLSGCPLECKFCINEKVRRLSHTKDIAVDELIKTVMQDYCYYVATDGGITFGGAEPLLQYKAISRFIDNINPFGVNVDIETSLNTEIESIAELIEKVSRFLIDIKDINSDIYINYTGIDNANVLKNLEYIASKAMQSKCRIRVPLIKGYNSNKDRDKSIEYLNRLGFTDLDLFEYTIRR